MFILTSLAWVVLTLLAIPVFFWAQYQWKNRKILALARRLPTVVPAWPILGHLPQCTLRHLMNLTETVAFIHLDIAFKAVKNNLKYYCIWVGPKPYITITNPEDLKVIFSKHLEKGEEFDHIKFVVENGLLTATEKVWKPTKNAVQPMFHPRNLQYMVPNFNEKSRELVEKLSKYAGKSGVEIQSKIQKTAASSVLEFIYGPEMELLNRSLVERNSIESIMGWFYLWTERTVSLTNRLDPVFHLLYHKKISEMREKTSFILDHAKKVLPPKVEKLSQQKQVKTSLDTGERLTFADSFSSLMASNKSFSFLDFYQNVCTILAAGVETTSFTLASFFLMLAIHQDVQDTVYEEIINIVGNTSNDVDYGHIKLLAYTEQVLKETMRLFPVFPVMTRRLKENAELSFGTIPAGAQVNLNVYGVHTDPSIYPDPLKFDPERFTPENVSKRHKFSFLPFGGGPRRCIGADYALLAIKTTLAHLIREYRFTTNIKIEDIQFVYNIGLQYKHGCYVNLSKRS